MVIMLQLNQEALLSIQLLVTCQVFAGSEPVVKIDRLVSRGDSETFTCNISGMNTTQINWTNGRATFAHSFLENTTWSTFTSPRVRIDPGPPSKLNILNVEHEDSGLYTCNVIGKDGVTTTEWNLTVALKPEETSLSGYLLYIGTSASGFLLFVFVTSAVCLCRKSWTRTPNQDLTLSYAQFHVQLGEEGAPSPQPHSSVVYRMDSKRRRSID